MLKSYKKKQITADYKKLHLKVILPHGIAILFETATDNM
jgi:hypothetical protein